MTKWVEKTAQDNNLDAEKIKNQKPDERRKHHRSDGKRKEVESKCKR